MGHETTSVRASFLVITLVALIWLGLSGWLMWSQNWTPASNFDLLQALATILTPIAALYALAAALGNRQQLPTAPQSDSLDEAEARLTGTVSRIEGLRQLLTEQLVTFNEAANSLESQAKAAENLTNELVKASDAATGASLSLQSILPEATRLSETLSASLQAAGEEAQKQAAAAQAISRTLTEDISRLANHGETISTSLSQSFAQLEEQATRGREQSDAGIRSIRAEADSLFAMLENTVAAKQQAVARQGDNMIQKLDEAYARLETLANDSAERLIKRLDDLSSRAIAIEGHLQTQIETTENLLTTGERAFHVLDARMNNSSQTCQSNLERLTSHVQQVSNEIGNLVTPVKNTETALGQLDTQVRSLREVTLQTVDVLADAIPHHTTEMGRIIDNLNASFVELNDGIYQTHKRTMALSEPVEHTRAALDEASQAYSAQRAAIEAAGQALVVELQQARLLIGEVEEQTRDTSLAAATRLVDAMARVRDVANQATGTMRDMLDGLLGETRESLSRIADETMRQSYIEPITLKIQETEQVASQAAERTAKSMAALAGTLRLLEERSNNRIAQFEQAQQEELLSAATLLTEKLANASVSISSALGREMDDADWAAWRKGERGMFNRRAFSLLDKREAKELKSLFENNDDFARSAREYTAMFEALIARFEAQSPALTTALLNSEQGRLAATLNEVMGH